MREITDEREIDMKILRTPDERFEGITDFPYEPCYTNIKTKDGSELRIHHIDEGPRDGPIYWQCMASRCGAISTRK